MTERPKINLGMSALDDLFKNDKELAEGKLAKIYDIPLELIDDFPEHPFKVRMDEDMDQLVDSIKERGLITPITLRKKEDGRYEIVSGHRRRKACEIAGFTTIKADVHEEMSRDEAVILMVESNFQRSVILPSEKAFSYKMRLEAMNRQGQKSTSCPVGTRSNQQLAEAVGDSARQVARYIRLTYLIPELLDLVDQGKMGMRPAVELSYLKPEEQKELDKALYVNDCTPSHDQAIRLRKASECGELNQTVIELIVREEKPNQKEKIHIKYDKVKDLIPKHVNPENAGDYIVEALQFYQKHLQQKRNKNVR